MTPEEFRDIRKKLGLSQNEIALDLGVADGRTVRRWESRDRAGEPERTIPGSVEITLAYWLRDAKQNRARIVLKPA